ncbi:MAG: hypothetical protein M1812_002897 [Candelaria pacifica]|nr:MAG: hypothetical protein M1812_002897 [Candelaria pacifica]
MASPGWSRPRLLDQVERHSYPTTSTPIPTTPSPTATTKKHLPSNLYIPPSHTTSTSDLPQRHPSCRGSGEVPQAPTSIEPYPTTEDLSTLPGSFPATPEAASTTKGADRTAGNSLGTRVIESQPSSSTSNVPEPSEGPEGAKPARKHSLIPKLFSRTKSPSKEIASNGTEVEVPRLSQEKTTTPPQTASPQSVFRGTDHLNSPKDTGHVGSQTSQEPLEPLVSSESTEGNPSISIEAPGSETSDKTLRGGSSTGQKAADTANDSSPMPVAESWGNTWPDESAEQKPAQKDEIRSPEPAAKTMKGHRRGHSVSSSANYTDHSGIPENYSSQDLAPPTKVRLDIFLESLNATRSMPVQDPQMDHDDIPHESPARSSKAANTSAIRFSETSREAWDDESQHSTQTLKRKRSGPSGPELIGTTPKVRRSSSSISHLIGFWEPIKDGPMKSSSGKPSSGARKQPELPYGSDTTGGAVPTTDEPRTPDEEDGTHVGLSNNPEAQRGATIVPVPASRDGSFLPDEAPGTLPDALSGMRPISDMTPPVLPRPAKGKVVVRKVRNAAWRPFLLKIALGRQLAAQTKPGLRMLAKGETLEEDDPLISNAH